MSETSLTIPDPRNQPVPVGYATSTFAPVADTLSWEGLDEAEGQLRALASYIESFDGDAVEFEKALRIIERRRGVLLGEPKHGGDRRGESFQVSRVEVDVSHPTASRYRKIARHWDDTIWPHLLEAKERRDVTQTNVLKLAARADQINDAAKIETCSTADLDSLAEGGTRFGTIYADPPWPYSNQATRASTDNHYDTPSLEWIESLPVPALTSENAHLHLWTTNAFIFDARKVMEAWGFTYKSCFVWVKPQMGIGNYWRVSHEFLLLGVKGKQSFLNRAQMSWGKFPRGKHSAKPAQLYDTIEKVSPGPWLELFARRQRDGWISWGNEIERDIFFKDTP